MPCVRFVRLRLALTLTLELARPSLLSRAAALPHDEATVPAHAHWACHGLVIWTGGRCTRTTGSVSRQVHSDFSRADTAMSSIRREAKATAGSRVIHQWWHCAVCLLSTKLTLPEASSQEAAAVSKS